MVGAGLFSGDPQGSAPRLRNPQGFTLVELIAALAISLLLVTAVIASLDIYLRLTTAGEESVERQQIARAVLSQMTRDMESIVFRAPDETTAEDARSEETDDFAAEPVVEVQDPDAAYTSGSLGLVGDSQSLVLHVSRPSKELSYSSFQQATGTVFRTSDLMSVSWFQASPGSAGLAGEVGNLAAAAQPNNAARSSST
ncbi:MAG: prepilin-type N-terminal cleavage/methylation domain-containing protein, partial [Planctomycetota bacterium]